MFNSFTSRISSYDLKCANKLLFNTVKFAKLSFNKNSILFIGIQFHKFVTTTTFISYRKIQMPKKQLNKWLVLLMPC